MKHKISFLILVFSVFPLNAQISLSRFSENVYICEDRFFSPENSLVYAGTDYVTLIGASWCPESARALDALIADSIGKPVREVINTNYHPDRAGGNPYWESIGCEIHATDLTYNLMKSDWENICDFVRQTNPDFPQIPLVLPTKVHKGNFTLQDGKIEVLYFGPSHTEDGVFVYLPDEKLLYGSCILKPFLGNLDQANRQEYPRTLDKLKKQGLDINTIIAGHGRPIHDAGLIDTYLVLLAEEAGYVRYSDFGAVGDGKADDIKAIAAAHAFANEHGLAVKANEGATYYIGGKERTAIIQSDTDFGTASFIIDDREVENRNAPVFLVSSSLQAFQPEGITSLKRNQEKIKTSLPGACLVTVNNSRVKRYIRYGPNQNNGSSQTDIFVVDKDGNVDMDAPVIWDFDTITKITALPIDEKTLSITGGHFTTIANRAESKYTYYSRNIAIRRSHVTVDGLEHHVSGEGEHGAPYGGFINIGDCAYVTVKNTILTGHKTYRTIGSAGRPVSMGSYDISVNRALNVSFINCSQTNDISDRKYWGIIGSNYSKNLLYDSCSFSRFDAHMGVANATIRNSTLGHMGINAIGTGTFLVENSTIRGSSLINLRSDYGSTWEGEFIIRDCIFVPANGRQTSASLISGSNSGQHDFGYTCYMPEKITIENLHIDDSNHPDEYQGPAIFAHFNPLMTDASYKEKFPYVITKELILRNVTTASGKALRRSDNSYMFKDVRIINEYPPGGHTGL